MFGIETVSQTSAVRDDKEAEGIVRVSIPELVKLSDSASSISLQAPTFGARQSGDYLSPFKGRGMEFDEARLYQPGDDIRTLDWRVTARTGKPHTKLFREERERPVFLWVDFRRPMFFATRGCYKSVMAARAASLLAWSANRHGDRVGGLVFSEVAHHETKPRRGKSGVLNLIHQLAQHPAWDGENRLRVESVNMRLPMTRLGRLVRPGSLVFLISDFRGLNRSSELQLIRVARHSETVMLFIYDPLESRLPPPGRYRMSDGQRELLLNSRSGKFAEEYRRRFDEHLDRLRNLSRRYGVRFLSCATNDRLLAVLQSGLRGRRQ